MCCRCSACANSYCTMQLTPLPQGRRMTRAKAGSRRPRSDRYGIPAIHPPHQVYSGSALTVLLGPQRQQKQRQLLGRLQDLLLGPKADEQTTCEVLDYFLRRLGSSQVASRVLAMKVSVARCVKDLLWLREGCVCVGGGLILGTNRASHMLVKCSYY